MIINITYLTLFIIYGVIVGSFLNVCIYRIPNKISVARGRSYCPLCCHTLGAIDLVPVVSYIFLGGKCRYCNAHISFRYAAVELLTGVLFGLTFITFHSIYAIIISLFFCVLIVVSFIDLDTGEIPDRLHVFIFAFAVLNIIGTRFISEYGITLPLSSYIIGFFAVSVPMLVIAYFTGGFGGGDIKLMAVSGLLLGWQNIVLGFFIGAFLGALYGAYLLITKKATGKSSFSFGPHLCIGMIISALFGYNIIQAYLNFAGL